MLNICTQDRTTLQQKKVGRTPTSLKVFLQGSFDLFAEAEGNLFNFSGDTYVHSSSKFFFQIKIKTSSAEFL